MSFDDLELEPIYTTEEHDLVKDFYIPCLRHSYRFKRAVGFFNARSFLNAVEGIHHLIKNDGKIKLILGSSLSEDESVAVHEGIQLQLSEKKEKLSRYVIEIIESEGVQAKKQVDLLKYLVAYEVLEIRFVICTSGMFHWKIGIFEDLPLNKVVYVGSANETHAGTSRGRNGEHINVFKSDEPSFARHGEIYVQKFDDLWEGRNSHYKMLTFSETMIGEIKQNIPSTRPELPMMGSEDGEDLALENKTPENIPSIPTNIELRPYQKEALQEWKNASWKGIFSMATGSGKTYTALYGATKYITTKGQGVLVVALPYINLAEQWVSDLELFHFSPIKCYGNSRKWETRFKNSLTNFRKGISPIICIVVVNKTLLGSETFNKGISKIDESNLIFIGDECHHHGSTLLQGALPNASVRMGLSATYERFNDDEGTRFLESYYGKKVIDYTLADGIRDGYLCQYEYIPVLVNLNENEVESFNEISKKIDQAALTHKVKVTSEVNNNPDIDVLLNKRSQILANASNKTETLERMIKNKKIDPFTLFYCGDGSVFDENDEVSIKQIDIVSSIINRTHPDNKPSHYTSRQTPRSRRDSIDEFKEGRINCLVAIRCLDEGVDIPACRTAYILASSRNPKQFIQRRGRILRKFEGKKTAKIYDFVVLLPKNPVNYEHEKLLFEEELKRVTEFAKHSLNPKDSINLLQEALRRYNMEDFFSQQVDDLTSN